MTFYFLVYFASFLTFLKPSDGGEACKIKKKLFWVVNMHFEEFGNFGPKCLNIPNLVFPSKFQFIFNFTIHKKVINETYPYMSLVLPAKRVF